MARTRSYSSEAGLAAGVSAYRYELVPYAWVTAGVPYPRWRLPLSSVGGVDLRPIAAQAAAGGAPSGFAFAACRQSPGGVTLASSFHMSETSATSGIQDTWQAEMGYRPQGATLTDLLWDQLTTGSDPTGQDGPRPLVPGVDGVLRLIVGGHSEVKSERFRWGIHPHTGRLRDMLRREFEEQWERTNGDDHCRRCLDATCEKYRVDDWREFVPQRLHPHVPGRLQHATTYTDNFNRANEALDASANWTEIDGTWTVTSNRAMLAGPDAAVRDARWNNDLSSSDNHCQTDTDVDSDGSNYNGNTCRYQSGADTGYVSEIEWSENKLVLYKRVTGTATDISSGGVSLTFTGGTPVTLKTEANGTTIKVYTGGVERISVTDSAIATGLRGGMWGFISGAGNGYWDNFESADLAAAAIPPWWARVGQMMGALSMQGQAYGGGQA